MNKIIVALDGFSKDGDDDRALALAKKLSGKVWGFKVNDFFVRFGMPWVAKLSEHGQIMFDMKFYDIPNTVENHCRSLFESYAQNCHLLPEVPTDDRLEIVTVHAHGGLDMMKAAVKVLPGKIAAVTVLTSFSENAYKEVCPTTQTIRERVVSLTKIALEAGCSHVVCSPEELYALQGVGAYTLKKVIPGIRPLWHQGKDDQKRTATPSEAIKNGADLLVIGRPITQAEDPVAAVEKTNEEIGG